MEESKSRLKARVHLIWALTLVIILIGFAIFKLSKSVVEIPERSSNRLLEFIKELKGTTVINSYISYTTQELKVSRFQFRTIEDNIVATKDDIHKWWPDAKVQITIPVTYTYFFDYKKEWSLTYDTTKTPIEIIIIAPPIEHNRPALHISQIERVKIKSTPIFNDGDKLLNSLERELEIKADSIASVKSHTIRAEAREAVKDHFSNWFKLTYPDILPELNIKVQLSDEISTESNFRVPKENHP